MKRQEPIIFGQTHMSCCCLYLISHYIIYIYNIYYNYIYIYIHHLYCTPYIYTYIIYIPHYQHELRRRPRGGHYFHESCLAQWSGHRSIFEESAETQVSFFSTVNICKKNTISDTLIRKIYVVLLWIRSENIFGGTSFSWIFLPSYWGFWQAGG